MMSTSAEPIPVGDLIKYPSPNERRDWNAFLGMVIFLASWIMLFGGIFLTYGALRARAMVWPPVDLPPLPLDLPGLNTLVIALSSGALHFGYQGIKAGHVRRLQWGLPLTLLLGSLFMLLQSIVWIQLWNEGLQIDTGPYGSVFYAMTAFHAVHVVIGLFALGWLSVQSWRGMYTPARYLSVRLWALYWHFVGIVWGVIFVTVYVL